MPESEAAETPGPANQTVSWRHSKGCLLRGALLAALILTAPIGAPMLWREYNLYTMMRQVPEFLEGQGYELTVQASGGRIFRSTGSGSYCIYEATFVAYLPQLNEAEIEAFAATISAHKFANPQTPDGAVHPKVWVTRAGDSNLLIELKSGPWDGWFDPRCR